MSKLEILQRTINYIKDLRGALDEDVPTSPTKLAEADIPKKPRARRTKSCQQLFPNPETTDTEEVIQQYSPEVTCFPSDFNESQSSAYNKHIESYLQPLPWQTQVEIVSREDQENYQSCLHSTNYADSHSPSSVTHYQTNTHAHSPVESHCSLYSYTTQSKSEESTLPLLSALDINYSVNNIDYSLSSQNTFVNNHQILSNDSTSDWFYWNNI